MNALEKETEKKKEWKTIKKNLMIAKAGTKHGGVSVFVFLCVKMI